MKSLTRVPVEPGARLHHRGRTLEPISTLDGLERLRPEWDELLADSAADGIFLTSDWISAWSTHLAGGRLRVLTVREEGRLIGLAPLLEERTRVLGIFPWSRVRLLGTGTAGSDYLDVILRRGYEEVAASLLAEQLLAAGVPAEFCQLREDGAGVDAVARFATAQGWSAGSEVVNVCPYIPLEGLTWEGYLATLGSEHRYNFNRRLRNLNKRFRVELRRAEDDAQRAEGLRMLMALHARRWDARGGSDAFNDPAIERFHDDVTRRCLARGWLRLYTLLLDGEPAAALYGFHYGGVFSFYQSGLEPRFAPHSVGLVLMGLCIQAAIQEGAREYDMLHGAERYKFLWARRSRALRRVTVLPPGRLGSLVRAERRLRRGAGAAAGRLLPATLLRRIAWWRGTPVPAAGLQGNA